MYSVGHESRHALCLIDLHFFSSSGAGGFPSAFRRLFSFSSRPLRRFVLFSARLQSRSPSFVRLFHLPLSPNRASPMLPVLVGANSAMKHFTSFLILPYPSCGSLSLVSPPLLLLLSHIAKLEVLF